MNENIIPDNENIINCNNYFKWLIWCHHSFPNSEKLIFVYDHLKKINDSEKQDLFKKSINLYGNLYIELNLKTSRLFTQYNKVFWIYNNITDKIYDKIF